ncbi:MAG: 50S ribosomal protein L21 [Patescibacteria group bacterium]
MFAIINSSGTQYKVEVGQKITVDLMEEAEGSTVIFDKVLLVSEGENTKIGMPLVENAYVEAKILNHDLADKIRVFKMKAKKRYSRTQGHRAKLTTLEITNIGSDGKKATVKVKKAAPAPKAKKPAAKKTTKAAKAE